MNRLVCMHRHSLAEHPQCAAEGNIIDRRENQLKPWYQEEGSKIGILDIESSGLKADFSQMLSWALKTKDGPVYYDYITKEELFNGTYDKRLVQSLLTKLKEYDIVIGYYSSGFDLPFVRAKALHYGLEFPGYQLAPKKNGGTKFIPTLFSWDLYPVVKYKLNLSRNSLDAACSYLGIEGKTPLDRDVWRRGAYGEPDAIQKIVEHNIGDVGITDALHTKLCDFSRWGKTSV